MSHENFILLSREIYSRFLNDITTIIKHFQTELHTWNKNTFGNILHQKRRIQDRMLGIQKSLDRNQDPQLLQLEKPLQTQLKDILEHEESI